MFTESAGQVVLVPRELQLPCSPLTVRLLFIRIPPSFPQVSNMILIFQIIDAKQARDLVAILSESKQQIDPRLAEMARYGSGGGGNRWGGRGRGRGGFTASNAAPLGNNRRW